MLSCARLHRRGLLADGGRGVRQRVRPPGTGKSDGGGIDATPPHQRPRLESDTLSVRGFSFSQPRDTMQLTSRSYPRNRLILSVKIKLDRNEKR